jgi:hypothetical protein
MRNRLLILSLVALLAAGCGILRPGGRKAAPSVPEGPYLLITSVIEGSEADRVGVKEGDIILSYRGKPVSTALELNQLRDEVKTGEVELVVLRNEKEEKKFKMKAGPIGVYLSERRPEVELASDAIVLKGVGKLGWNTGMSSSFIGALTVAADYLGVKKDYTYLMGVSGGAFRLHFHKGWCPSSPDATVGLDTGTEAMKALGFTPEYHFLAGAMSEFGETREALTKLIMESIDADRPVIAIDLIEVPEWGVITGYQKGGSELLCRTYFDRQEGYSVAEKFPWAIVVITEVKTPPSDLDNYKNAFRIAREAASTEMFGDYYSGTAAIENWIKRLQMDNFAAMKPDTFENCWLANAWIYERAVDDRTQASEFLDRLAGEFPKYTEALVRLSTIYKDQVQILKGAAKNAPFPMAGGVADAWTGDMRAGEVKALEAVLVKEKEANEILEEINANM